MGVSGCVSFVYEKGLIIADKEECDTLRRFNGTSTESGADDFIEEEDSYEIYSDPSDFSNLRLEIEKADIK